MKVCQKYRISRKHQLKFKLSVIESDVWDKKSGLFL